jgi:hypothetical protein
MLIDVLLHRSRLEQLCDNPSFGNDEIDGLDDSPINMDLNPTTEKDTACTTIVQAPTSALVLSEIADHNMSCKSTSSADRVPTGSHADLKQQQLHTSAVDSLRLPGVLTLTLSLRMWIRVLWLTCQDRLRYTRWDWQRSSRKSNIPYQRFHLNLHSVD